MQVKLRVAIACPAGTFEPGESPELPDAVAAGLIEAGLAEAVGLAEPEIAEAPDDAELAVEPEAARPRGSRRGRK